MGSYKIYLLTIIILVNLFSLIQGQNFEDNTNITCRKEREIVIENVSDLSVFYSLKDNTTIKEMLPRPWYIQGRPLRLPFIGEPCACRKWECGCCAGIRIPQISFDKKACTNITYDPFLFAIIMDVNLNGLSVVHRVFSAKNPPQVCVPIPLGQTVVSVDFCVKLFEIYTPEVRNLHVCMDWEIRIAQAPVLILHFDCLKFGYDGIAIVRPDNIVTQKVPEETDIALIEPTQANGEIYDEVTEIRLGYIAENLENTTYIIEDNNITYDDVENDTLIIQNDINGKTIY